MTRAVDLQQLSPDQLRELATQLLSTVQAQEQTIAQHHAVIAQRDEAIQRYKTREAQLTHELALLRRHRQYLGHPHLWQ